MSTEILSRNPVKQLAALLGACFSAVAGNLLPEHAILLRVLAPAVWFFYGQRCGCGGADRGGSSWRMDVFAALKHLDFTL